jgi:hypothetical protein
MLASMTINLVTDNYVVEPRYDIDERYKLCQDACVVFTSQLQAQEQCFFKELK